MLLANSAYAGSTGATSSAGSFVGGTAYSSGNASSVQTGVDVATAVGVATYFTDVIIHTNFGARYRKTTSYKGACGKAVRQAAG